MSVCFAFGSLIPPLAKRKQSPTLSLLGAEAPTVRNCSKKGQCWNRALGLNQKMETISGVPALRQMFLGYVKTMTIRKEAQV